MGLQLHLNLSFNSAPGTQVHCPSHTLGAYPLKVDTVVAETLAKLLKGEGLTSMDAVFTSSTTRLPQAIHTLCKQYGWTIDREDEATGCVDGRVAKNRRYTLSSAVIKTAQKFGAQRFILAVETARRHRAGNAWAASRKANSINASQRRIRKMEASHQGINLTLDLSE